jgi:hypothetical protein
LGLLPLYRRRRYGEHLTFSVHFFAALLLFMVLIIPVVFFGLAMLARGVIAVMPGSRTALQAAFASEGMVVLLIYGPMLWYLVVALRRVYGGRTFKTLIYGLLLVFWHLFLIVIVFRDGLFFTTYYSLKWFGE